MEIIDEPDPKQAAIKAVAMCREGEADILMKGTVNTDVDSAGDSGPRQRA